MHSHCLLYYITDRSAFAGNEHAKRRTLLDKIWEAAMCGVDYIQLREKDLSARHLGSLASEVVGMLKAQRTENRELRTALLINSRTDVAMAVGADGVHLRSEDVSPEDARTTWGLGSPSVAPPTIGVSCHSPAEVEQAAMAKANFAVFGPVFGKKDAPPTGLNLLREACQAKIPVVALGGVTLKNAQSCLEAGAAGLAAIRLFQENDIAEVVKRLRG